MKLEVGMYAYSKNCRDHGIGKIVNITEHGLGFYGDLIDIQYKNSETAIGSHNVIASFDIIDLIEVGDYVNGARVTDIDVTYFNGNDRLKEPKRIGVIVGNNEMFKFSYYIKKGNIKTIVTKEQFGYVSYKIEV